MRETTLCKTGAVKATPVTLSVARPPARLSPGELLVGSCGTSAHKGFTCTSEALSECKGGTVAEKNCAGLEEYGEVATELPWAAGAGGTASSNVVGTMLHKAAETEASDTTEMLWMLRCPS